METYVHGRKISINTPENTKASNAYDVMGRLLEKTGDKMVYYVYDVNRAYEQVLQTYDDNCNTINTYTYGLQRIQSVGETTETYLYDGRGSVI